MKHHHTVTYNTVEGGINAIFTSRVIRDDTEGAAEEHATLILSVHTALSHIDNFALAVSESSIVTTLRYRYILLRAGEEISIDSLSVVGNQDEGRDRRSELAEAGAVSEEESGG